MPRNPFRDGKMVDLIDYCAYLNRIAASARARGKAAESDGRVRKAPNKKKKGGRYAT